MKYLSIISISMLFFACKPADHVLQDTKNSFELQMELLGEDGGTKSVQKESSKASDSSVLGDNGCDRCSPGEQRLISECNGQRYYHDCKQINGCWIFEGPKPSLCKPTSETKQESPEGEMGSTERQYQEESDSSESGDSGDSGCDRCSPGEQRLISECNGQRYYHKCVENNGCWVFEGPRPPTCEPSGVPDGS